MRYPALLLPLCLCVATTFAAEWTDQAGTRFKGEPVGSLGPFALFRTGATGAKRVLWRGLAPADARRFAEQAADRPARAELWQNARSPVSAELVGRCLLLTDGKFAPADFTSRPEPELILALYGSHNDGESWHMVHNLTPTHHRIQRVHPGLLATVFVGVRHTPAEHRRMAMQTSMPYLIADPEQSDGLRTLSRFVPAEGPLLVLLTRDGLPLLSARAYDIAAIQKFTDDLLDLLWQINPANGRHWRDRLAALAATRPLQPGSQLQPPVLVGDPIDPALLRHYGLSRLAATLAVDANGRVTAVNWEDSTRPPTALAEAVDQALKRYARFSPALSQGQPTAATYAYEVRNSTAPSDLSADTAWLDGKARAEIPLGNWLVLRPIPVPPARFSSQVSHVTADGTAVLTAVEVSGPGRSKAAQLSAFDTDWFTTTGAASVTPKEGDSVIIDEQTVRWESVRSDGGLVDLQSGARRDYCIGYAWTEVTVPAAQEAWLGIGSDDGLKIWLNGELVHDRWIRRLSRLDDDVVPLRLAAGKNRLLIKIQNATGDWSFIARLRSSAP